MPFRLPGSAGASVQPGAAQVPTAQAPGGTGPVFRSDSSLSSRWPTAAFPLRDGVLSRPMTRSRVYREYLVDRRGEALHVLLTGEVDVLSAPALRRAIDRAVAADGSRIVINLDAVTSVDSAGLG